MGGGAEAVIAAVAAWLAARGVPPAIVRPLIWLVIAAIVIGLCLLLVRSRDADLIEQHDARQAVQVERQARSADAEASGERRADDSRVATEKTELTKVIENAPTTADQPVSDARRAFLRCVRLQQEARAARRPAPPC